MAIAELEKIDRKADKLGISFVKIADLELVDEYGLTGIPSLVYYRHQAPIVFEGEELMIKGCKKEQVRQCLGLCTAYFRSWCVYESAVQKPKHYLACSFLHPLLVILGEGCVTHFVPQAT